MNSSFVTTPASRARLLIIDSDPDSTARLERMLADIDWEGFEIDQAVDWPDAADRSRGAGYDACLVNWKTLGTGDWPGMAGADGSVELPVIVLAESREEGLRALHAGAADYLEWKHLSPELLERSIRYVLQKQELARQAAMLASEHSARLLVQKRNFRLTLLSEAAGELLSVEDPVELLGRLYPKLAAHLRLDCYVHHLVDETTEKLVLNGYSGVPESVLPDIRHLDFDDVVSGSVPPAAENGGRQDAPRPAMARKLGVRAYFCYPLMLHGFIVGTLSFGSRRRRRFSASELIFLQTICHYVATALERKRLARELTDRANRLAQSEYRFRVMAETVPDVLLTGQADGSCDFCNQQFCDYTGLTREQVAGAGWLEAMHPEDAERVRQEWRRLCCNGESIEVEHRFRTADGTYRWFVGRWRGICGEGGEVLRWIGSCADIDDLKRAEKALRENQARLHQAVAEAERRALEAEDSRRVLDAVMEHVPIGIAVADRPDAIRLVSRHGRQMFAASSAQQGERTTGETIASALQEIISLDHPSSPLARAMRSGETTTNEEICVRGAHGTSIPLLCSAGPIRDGSGRTTGAVVAWMDITERKRAERVLKQSERQFRAIFETSPDCIVIVDEDLRLTKVNPAAVTAFGLDGDSLIGRSLTEFLQPPGGVEEMRRALLQTGRYTGEVQIVRRNGEVFEFDVGAAFSIIPGRHLIVFHDTTRRRQMERQLRESESQFRTLAQALPQIVWTAEPDGRVDFYNDQVTRCSGLSVEEACRDGWQRLLHPDDVDRTSAAWRHAVESGENYQVEHRIREKDGTYRWFLSRGLALRDDEGRIVKWFGTATDIDDQKRAEQTLAREHAAVENERRRLRAVLDVLPVAVFITNREGKVTDVNPAVATTWGRLPVLSESLEDFAAYYQGFSPKTGKMIPASQRGLARALREGEAVAAEEMEFKRADGRRGTILNYAVPIRDVSGEIIGGVAVSVDITDLKRTQRQLLELNDALEQRVRERTRSLVTYQEHLRAMTSELVLTEQRERRRLATELHDYLAQLLVASKMKSKLVSNHIMPSGEKVMQDLRELIDEALKYTRTLITDLSPTILYEAGLFAAIHWLGEQMERHGLTVRIEQHGESVDMPDDKAVMIFQTVRELLFNVVKHARVSEATVRLEQESGELRVTVQDEGAGFDISRQESHPAGGKYGLLSVRERLAALGGSCEITSAPGQGTRVLVRVPIEVPVIDQVAAAEEAAVAVVPSACESRRRDTIRVLLVDDHKMVREGFRTLIECDPQLEVAGEAANGEEAIELARLLQPDVVIMDINMPKMNGIEATRRIKLEMPHVSVIGLSVHDDRGLITSMLEAGASSYLTKGGQSEELSRAIHATYEGQMNQSK